MDPVSALVRAELEPRAMNVHARSAIDNYVTEPGESPLRRRPYFRSN
jgi:hypothetical protein